MTASLATLAEVLRTNEKNALTRAVRMRLTPYCGRCGGSGRYSFNMMDGSKCYGCNGAGHTTVTKKNLAETIEAAKEAVADGRLDQYIKSLQAQKMIKANSDRIFDTWKNAKFSKLNPHHFKRDHELTPVELAARQANHRVYEAYEVYSKLTNKLYGNNVPPEDYLACSKAIEDFFELVKKEDAAFE